MSTLDAARRLEAERHIREHVEGERSRIERLSRIRELVLGVQDGLLVPLGVVSGMAAANPGRAAILVAGLAEAVAGRSQPAPYPQANPTETRKLRQAVDADQFVFHRHADRGRWGAFLFDFCEFLFQFGRVGF
jgi:hypothetical protein